MKKLLREGFERRNLGILAGILVFACAAGMPAQKLLVSGASGAPGDEVLLQIAVDFPPAREPVALQWETDLSAALFSFEPEASAISTAARDAGKTLTCAPRQDGPAAVVCVVAGGVMPIGNGPVAVLRFRIKPEARVGAARVRLTNGSAADADSARMQFSPAQEMVTIRRK